MSCTLPIKGHLHTSLHWGKTMNDALQELFGFLSLAAIIAGLSWLFFKFLKWMSGRFRLSPPTWLLVTFSITTVLALVLGTGFLTLSHRAAYAPSPTSSAPPRPRPTFPWPPPTPSARLVIPKQVFSNSKTLGQAVSHLENALSDSGYVERSYFLVPGGIAVVTRLEQIHRDGTPFSDPDRWLFDDDYRQSLGIAEYLRRLFAVDEGYYRIVVFVLTDEAFGAQSRSITEGEATLWLSQGLNVLPSDLVQQPLSENKACTALIYEFQKLHGGDPHLLLPSALGAKQHLVASGLYPLLLSNKNGGSR